MTKEDLKDYLIEEAEYSEEDVNNMDAEELVNAWLTWNGIIGYTSDVLKVVAAAYENNLKELKDYNF